MDFKAKTFGELTATEIYEILKSRSEVFLLEQGIICQDMDDVDYDSLHCFFEDGNRVSAYLRAYAGVHKSAVKIGRVLTLEHGKGLGRKLWEESITEIKKTFPECRRICLNAQKTAVGFYEKLGFKITSGEFLEEGVVHLAMELSL